MNPYFLSIHLLLDCELVYSQLLYDLSNEENQ